MNVSVENGVASNNTFMRWDSIADSSADDVVVRERAATEICFVAMAQGFCQDRVLAMEDGSIALCR